MNFHDKKLTCLSYIRKRTRSNDDHRDKLINQEDRRSYEDQTRTVVFGNEKRFRK